MTQRLFAVVWGWCIRGKCTLFGVYGVKSIGLITFSCRGLVNKEHVNDGVLKIPFIGFNLRLLLLTLRTLFTAGIL